MVAESSKVLPLGEIAVCIRGWSAALRVFLREISRVLAVFILFSSVAFASDVSEDESDAESERIVAQMRSLSASLSGIPELPRLDRTIELPSLEEAEEKEPLVEEELEKLEEDLEKL